MGTSIRAKNPFLFNSLVKLKHLHRKYSRKPFSRRRFLKCYGVRCSILLYINLSIFGTLPIPVCLHPLNHPVFPLPYGAELNWFQCLWNIVLECVKHIITVLPQVLLDCTLKELNKVEFTVKLGQEDTQMPSCFNDFLNTGFLLICNACCLLLGSFRLSAHVLDSRTYHWGAETGPICENTTFKKKKCKSKLDFAVVAVLHSHYTLLVVTNGMQVYDIPIL